jgi:microcystin degradation protein MlrC
MSIRIAVGGIVHESNTYCQGTTGLQEFKQWRGTDVIANSRGVRDCLGGMIDAAAAMDATLVPIAWFSAEPSGAIAADAYRAMLEELLAGISAALPVDAVALDLHGAAVAEGVDDVDGALCRAVRERVGPDVKMVATLDLHGNLTQAMADTVECMFGYHDYPHTDMYERGYEAITIIPRLLSGAVQPVTHVETLPLLLPAAPTAYHPAKAVNELCAEIEGRPGVIDCTFFHGFPYTDIPYVGAHIVATANGDRALARASAKEVARWIWAHREDFRRASLTPDEAIAQALAVEGGPVVINDTADNSGGGAPGDGTHLLRAMLAANLRNACIGWICDPEVAQIAHRAGAGATIDVALGGKHDDFHGQPLAVAAYVKCLTDGKFVLQALGKGTRVNLGKMARLQVGGIDIVVSSARSQTFDPEPFLLHGIDVTRYKIVAVKSSAHFRAGFEPLAKAIITADSPGLTTLRVDYFHRARSPRPIWPLDANARYEG